MPQLETSITLELLTNTSIAKIKLKVNTCYKKFPKIFISSMFKYLHIYLLWFMAQTFFFQFFYCFIQKID